MLNRFANPARFMRASGKALPWLGAATGFVLAGRPVLVACRGAARLSAGRNGADHVHPCAGRVDGAVDLSVHRGFERGRAGLAASARRDRGAGGGAGRGGFHPCLPRDRLALGAADVGRVVGMGRAADLGAGAVFPVSRLYRAGERVRRPQPRRARRGALGPGRRRQPADHQVLGRLVEYAAPARQRRADGGTGDRAVDAAAAAGDGGRVYAAVLMAAAAAHADRPQPAQVRGAAGPCPGDVRDADIGTDRAIPAARPALR